MALPSGAGIKRCLPALPGGLEIALQVSSRAEIRHRARHRSPVAARLGQLKCLVMEIDCGLKRPLVVSDIAQVIKCPCHPKLVTGLPPDLERLPVQSFGRWVIANVLGKTACPVKSHPKVKIRRLARHHERLLQPGTAFVAEMAK